MKNSGYIASFIWKFLERAGYVVIQFVVQIVLARLLDPEHFGVLAIMVAFTNIVQVFTQNGLNMALVQNKDVTDEDYSSAFFVNMGIMSLLYAVLYIAAPWIEAFYGYTDFAAPFRALGLTFFLTGASSIQIAKLTREMRFRPIFFCSLAGVVLSGTAGILMAYNGCGIWALVAQYLINHGCNLLCMAFVARLRLKPVINWKRIQVLFSFGGKMMLGNLLSILHTDINSFIIGKRINASSLAFYNKGKLFPQNASNIITSTTQSVMLPMLARKQEQRQDMLNALRKTMQISTYLVAPALLGLLSVSELVVKLLLTDKWLPCVPFMQAYCVMFMVYQIHAVYTQALNANGYSGITLMIQFWMTVSNILICVIACFVFESVLIVAWGGVFTMAAVGVLPDMYFCKKKLGYGFKMQLSDTLLSLVMAAGMLVAVMLLGQLAIPALLKLLVQVAAGAVIYVVLSVIFKPDAFRYLLGIVKKKGLKVR